MCLRILTAGRYVNNVVISLIKLVTVVLKPIYLSFELVGWFNKVEKTPANTRAVTLAYDF